MADYPPAVNQEDTTQPSKPKLRSKRIQEKDIDTMEQFIGNELSRRRESQHRKSAERRWKEVDRQVRMEPMMRLDRDNQPIRGDEWRAAVEVGELSKALEIVSSDVRRLIFPNDRTWFEAHSKIDAGKNEDGTIKQPDAKLQTITDNALRSMMVQQQKDIGLKDRHELSVKEALLHGSYVTEVRYEPRLLIDEGYKVKSTSVPVWVPHSMWNCYPDPSPSVIVGDLFYQGSMIILHYLPRYKLEQMSGDGWMNKRFDKVPKNHKYSATGSTGTDDRDYTEQQSDTDEIELVTYYGDINVERSQDDLFFPNSKACFANGILVYFSPSELPYLPIIFRGYEKQDVRDPYFVSPLMKLEPLQKTASIMLNRFIDLVELKVDPPIVYNGNDPAFVRDGGPRIFPGAKTASKGSGDVKVIETGDPAAALAGFKESMNIIQQGLGVDAVRSGTTAPSGRTAFEINKVSQSAEVRTLDFIDKLEPGLETYLYMQHDLNRKYLKQISYYNDDLDTPDYLIVGKKDLPQFAKFTVVGSKSTLGEDQRVSRTSQVTSFLLGNPVTAELVNIDEVAKIMYQDAGIQNPERLLNTQQSMDPKLKKIMDATKQKMQETQQMAQQAVQQAGEQIKKLTEQLQAETAKCQALQADKSLESQKLQLESAKHEGELQLKNAEFGLKQQAASQATESANQDMQGDNMERQAFMEALHPILIAMQQSAHMMMLAAEKSTAPRYINLVEEGGRVVGGISQTTPTVN